MRLLSRPRFRPSRGRAGVSLDLDGCEARLGGGGKPVCVPATPGCLFTGTVCVPAPPGVFLPVPVPVTAVNDASFFAPRVA